MRCLRILGVGILLLAPLGEADVRQCVCDAARPETMESRECALCRVADAQPPGAAFFAIRDASPSKPNRWLELPRFHGRNPQDLAGMTAAERAAYWTAAIAKARELWGDGWGLAVNSLERRTQCHMHIHIGKLAVGVEDSRFVEVAAPADIPLPRAEDGILVHSAAGRLHVHYGDDSPELLLER
jgi:diadenosine tetraphosphate (Ap4A) HIT family hydrolase